MPTLDQLPSATAAADTDELLVSQGGIARKVTRAQLLASAQPAIALSAGQLLGRSGTAGAPQAVGLGANLLLANGTLTAGLAPFAALPAAGTPQATDLVPLSRAGTNMAASYAQIMQGLSGISGISANGLSARPAGAATTRLLPNILAGTIAIEDFGAVGDGLTDDSAALSAALAAGVPVRLGPKTYAIAGQFVVAGAAATLLGVPGRSVLRRAAQTGNGAWISVQSSQFVADGIFFDANTGIGTDSWAVLVTPACTASRFTRCVFANARGATQGAGLTFQAADPAVTIHEVVGCEATGNAVHGIWVQALQNVQITGCQAHANGQIGICIDYTDPAFVQKLHQCQISSCTAWGNQRGISVGNFNATNTIPAVWGNANPDAISIQVADNLCHDNSVYGIAASGLALSITGNQLYNNGVPGGAGLLANVSYSRVAGNMVAGGSFYGIDAGGSIDSDIAGNYVTGCTHGITPGGSSNMRVSGNYVTGCSGWGILVNNVETDGAGHNFGIACNNLDLSENWIGFSSGSGGILLLDNPSAVRVVRNCIVGSGPATVGQALWPNSATAFVHDNSWNFSQRVLIGSSLSPAGTNQLVFPDLLDAVVVNTASNPIQSMVSTHAAAIAGQLGYIAVTAGGSGYTTASVAVTGDGAGAAAIAYVSNGAVIGISLTNAGTGYSTASITLSGDGAEAAATAQIALPVLEQRTLAVRCGVRIVFSRAANSTPQQVNWTNYDFTVPPTAEVVFSGRNGTWRAGAVPLADYIAPDGNGGAMLTTSAGDLVLAPTGHLRIATATETTGITSSIGRGPPGGVVSATPGSDYRNLNGGAGATYWIKQTGVGTAGWVAVA